MKTKFLASLIGVVALLSFAGCATPAVTSAATAAPRRTQAVFDAPKDKVWPLLVAEVAMNYPTQAIEKDSGLLTTQFVTINAGLFNGQQGRWIVPPGGFLSTYDGLRMNMRILAVELEPGKTKVAIQCHYEAYENNVRKTWIVAQSNGSIEEEILSRIEGQLAPAAPKS